MQFIWVVFCFLCLSQYPLPHLLGFRRAVEEMTVNDAILTVLHYDWHYMAEINYCTILGVNKLSLNGVLI